MEPAGFLVGERPMVRLPFWGKTRRVALLRVGWVLAHHEWPKGAVQPRDSDPWNARPDNLEIVSRCAHKPHLKGSPASSLARRQTADQEMLAAMVSRPNATVEELGELTNVSRARASTRLTKLAKLGLTESPMCVPGRAWALTGAGRTVALGDRPLLDGTDQAILGALRSVPMGPVRLARRIDSSEPTITRRARLPGQKGLVFYDPRRFYEITKAGREALGDSTPLRPWIDIGRISAALSPDVSGRVHVPEMSTAQKTKFSSKAAAVAKANARRGQNIGGVMDAEFEERRLRA
jgi:Mn-dependent DtxR family transcriptional regulator